MNTKGHRVLVPVENRCQQGGLQRSEPFRAMPRLNLDEHIEFKALLKPSARFTCPSPLLESPARVEDAC